MSRPKNNRTTAATQAMPRPTAASPQTIRSTGLRSQPTTANASTTATKKDATPSTALYGAALQQELMRSLMGGTNKQTRSSAPLSQSVRQHNSTALRRKPEHFKQRDLSKTSVAATTTSSGPLHLQSAPRSGSNAPALALTAQIQPHKLTLAQQLGLRQAPQPHLTPEQWHAVEQQAIERRSALSGCCICCDSLAHRVCVLLSCAHVIHHSCLASLERFTIRAAQSLGHASQSVHHCCPMCRSVDYEKRTTEMPRRECRLAAAQTLQRLWRGVRVRMQIQHMSSSPERRYDALARCMTRRHNKLSALMSQRESAIDALFAELDSSVAVSRSQINSAGREMQKINFSQQESESWQQARRQAKERLQLAHKSGEEEECAICVCPLQPLAASTAATSTEASSLDSVKGKSCVLLSCSHLLHANCLAAYEKFAQQSAISSNNVEASHKHPSVALQCPLCRSNYESQPF